MEVLLAHVQTFMGQCVLAGCWLWSRAKASCMCQDRNPKAE